MNDTINIPRDKLETILYALEQHEATTAVWDVVDELRAMLAQPTPSGEINAPVVSAVPVVNADDEWRTLALQFDDHRMQALGHLRAFLKDVRHGDVVAAFLCEPPLGGEAVLAERIAALSRIVPASPAVDDNERIGWISKAGLKALRKGASVTIHINSCGKFDRPIYLGAKAASPVAPDFRIAEAYIKVLEGQLSELKASPAASRKPMTRKQALEILDKEAAKDSNTSFEYRILRATESFYGITGQPAATASPVMPDAHVLDKHHQLMLEGGEFTRAEMRGLYRAIFKAVEALAAPSVPVATVPDDWREAVEESINQFEATTIGQISAMNGLKQLRDAWEAAPSPEGEGK